MFSTTIDNAIIAYARNATGISKAIWAFQNAEKETAPFIVITPLNITDLDGVRSETGYKHKGVSLRFDVYTDDATHLLKGSLLLDYADNDEARSALYSAGVTFINALTDVTDATYLEDAYYKYRAFIDIRFGMVFEHTETTEYIERVSGTILDEAFDVTNQND